MVPRRAYELDRPLLRHRQYYARGDLRSNLVLVVDLQEPRRLAGGFGDRLLAIGFRGLGDLRHAPARLRDDAIGIGLRLVLRTFGVDACRLHVAERVDDLRRRIDLLQLHLGDLNAGAIMVEGALHQVLNPAFDRLPGPGQDRLNLRTPDHLAHGALGHRLHRAFRMLDIEQIFADPARLDQPEHRELDVDDVLVPGKHQALFGNVAHGAAAAVVLDEPHADVDLVHAQSLRGERGLDRIRYVIIEPGLHIADVFAEPQHDAELVGLDPEEAGKSPQRQHGERDQRKAAAAETPARQHGPELVLAAAQQLLEVRRSGTGGLRSGAPGPLSGTPRPAVLTAPRHEWLQIAGRAGTTSREGRFISHRGASLCPNRAAGPAGAELVKRGFPSRGRPPVQPCGTRRVTLFGARRSNRGWRVACGQGSVPALLADPGVF